MTNSILTQEELKAQLHYNEYTGIFTRIRDSKLKVGSINSNGYLAVYVKDKIYMAHRLAWLYVYGDWPNDLIDHINSNKTDNRICNLRSATFKQNQENIISARKNNKAGLLGVFWCKKHEKYCASIRHNRRLYHLGYFDDKYIAHNKYIEAKRKLHEYGML